MGPEQELELQRRRPVRQGLRRGPGRQQDGRRLRFSPRLAANFDPTGSGRNRISLSYGRYVSKVDQGPADSTSTSGRYSSYYWDYAGPAINSALGNTPSGQIVPIPQLIQQVFNWFQSVGGTNNMQYLASAWIPGVSSRFDHSLKAPYMDEMTLGYALTFGPSGYVRADLIDRKWASFYVTTRTIQTGKAMSSNGTLFDQGVIENASNGLSRKYQGLQVQGSYRIAKPFSVGANYTYSKLRGNVEGETPSFATGTTDYNNYPEYTTFAQYNPVGYLGADMRHRLNAWAQYDLPTPIGRFNLSLLERYHSAQSYSATGTIDIRAGVSNGPVNGIVNPGYVTPPSYVNYYFGDRGALRVDNIASTDLGINWYAPPISSASFFVEADVINIFNQQGIENPAYINQTVNTRRQTACIQTGSTSRCLAFNPFTDTPKLGVNYQYGPIFGQPTSPVHTRRRAPTGCRSVFGSNKPISWGVPASCRPVAGLPARRLFFVGSSACPDIRGCHGQPAGMDAGTPSSHLVHALLQCGGRSLVERHMPRRPLAALLLQHRHGNRIVETPRPCAGGIEIPDVTHVLVMRQMAVTKQHNVRLLARQRLQHLARRFSRTGKVVRQQDLQIAEGDAHDVVAARAVDVAGNCSHRRQLAQRIEDALAADVAGVQDVVDARERFAHFRPEQPVRVRDQSDAHGANVAITASPPAAGNSE